MSNKPFTLPLLPPPPQYHHWLEAHLRTWHKAIERRQAIGLSGCKRLVYAMARRLVRREIRSGRKEPLPYRLWYSVIGRLMLRALPAHETANNWRSIFQRASDSSYRSDYVIVNFVTAIILMLLIYFNFGTVAKSAYILTTYQHDKYTEVMVTSHYRDFSMPHVFAVHGKKTSPDGEEEELFFEIGPSIWFLKYNPESVFEKITDSAVCAFDAYGLMLRIPLALRFGSNDALYALHPWIVDVRCDTPQAD